MNLQYILCAHAENCPGINGILQAAPFLARCTIVSLFCMIKRALVRFVIWKMKGNAVPDLC